MAYGIENRSPFLDSRLIRLIGLPVEKKVRNEYNKIILRQNFSNFVELPTQWRSQKQGFRWPSYIFLEMNKDKVLESISESSLIREMMHVSSFLDDAIVDNNVFKSQITTRALGVALFEQSFRC